MPASEQAVATTIAYRLGALTMAARLYLLTNSASDRKVLIRLVSAEFPGLSPIPEPDK